MRVRAGKDLPGAYGDHEIAGGVRMYGVEGPRWNWKRKKPGRGKKELRPRMFGSVESQLHPDPDSGGVLVELHIPYNRRLVGSLGGRVIKGPRPLGDLLCPMVRSTTYLAY